jgi:hypothetical protein
MKHSRMKLNAICPLAFMYACARAVCGCICLFTIDSHLPCPFPSHSAAEKLSNELATGTLISGKSLSAEKQLASTLAEEVREQLNSLPAHSPAKAKLEVCRVCVCVCGGGGGGCKCVCTRTSRAPTPS